MPADRRHASGPGTPPPVVFLMGPTASGKTGLAVDLAARWPLDIVSVDSAMVYRGMDIGTAKPDAAVQAAAPHRLIDIRDPTRAYSAAEFATDARNEIEAIHARGRIPLLVGGTMLYFRALERGLSPLPPADPAVRERLSARAQQAGWPALHAELAAADPVTGARLHPNDGQRIQRALEILTLSGQPPSRLLAESGEATMPWPAIKLAVAPTERHTLHTRIDRRFRSMMDAGFLGEVENLWIRPDLQANMPAMRAVGYRQLWHCLDGHEDLETAVGRGVVATRQLAKRQLTWLRREQDLTWLNADDPQLSEQAHEALACRLKLA